MSKHISYKYHTLPDAIQSSYSWRLFVLIYINYREIVTRIMVSGR